MQLDDRSRKPKSVESLNAAERSWREAEVGRVVELELDDRSGKLKSVESFWLLAGTASRRG